MGRARRHCMVGAAAIAAATAFGGCTAFDTEDGSRPAPDGGNPNADDAGTADDAGAADGAGVTGARACAPFQCPADAILCEDFETWPIAPSSGWIVQGTVSPVQECTGTALAGNVPAASSPEPRRARVVRDLSTDLDRREFFLDLDAWVEPKGAFTKSGFGTILAISAISGGGSRGFVGLSFGVDGLVTVVRSTYNDVNRATQMPYGIWVHVSLHVKFAETKGLVEVAIDGETVTSFEAVTLAGSLDGFSLQVGALTDEDSTPELTMKVDNIVLR